MCTRAERTRLEAVSVASEQDMLRDDMLTCATATGTLPQLFDSRLCAGFFSHLITSVFVHRVSGRRSRAGQERVRSCEI